MIRVVLPYHLRGLARVDGEVQVEATTTVEVLEALERAFPALAGTLRDHTGKRRPFVRFFACQRDLSHDDPAALLPAPVLDGAEPFLVVGAMASG